MGELHVRHDAAPEERADAALRAIEELVRDDDVLGRVVLAEAPDGAGREDPLDAQHLEAEDVRPEVQLGAGDPVARAVAREERHPAPVQRGRHERAGRRAEGRVERHLVAVREVRHVVETRTADDADLAGHGQSFARCLSSTRTPCVLAGWMNAMSAPSAPGRGDWSISRTPRSFSRASAPRCRRRGASRGARRGPASR